MIEVPKMPDMASMMVDDVDIGPSPALKTNEELEKLNATMEKVLDQLTRIQGWLVKIDANTRKSAF